MDDSYFKEMEKKGYRFAGKNKHSAVKVCTWVKNSLTGKGTCYKHRFYGIESWRCLQMTPSVPFCNQNCQFCWRNPEVTKPEWSGPVDEPKEILDECIEGQRELIKGFGGNPNTDKKRYAEAMKPNQVAVSLDGEPTLYPKICELIDEIKSRGMTAFLVSNGTNPDVIKKLMNHQPTNLYISLDAPDEENYLKTCRPSKNYWQNIMKSLSFLKDFDCNTVIRLTLVKGLNMISPEKYAEMIEKASPDFLEVKAFMSVSFARERLGFERMPEHSEIREFSEKISKHCSYEIKDEQPISRVVLLTKN